MLFDLEDHSDPFTDNILGTENASSFIAVNTENSFQLDYSQFIELIRSSYTSTNIMDKNFGKYISFGVFQYYCVLLLWMRLYFIVSGRGLKIAETSQLNALYNFTLPAPLDIKLYLQGIGDLQDVTGHQYLINIQGTLSNLNYNRAQGSYGKVTVSNLIIYETLPSMLISLLKIQADMLLDSNGIVDWNLPYQIKLDGKHALNPNRNFLCWWPAEKLTLEQNAVLSAAKITSSNFNVVNVGFLPINVLLVKSVAQQLKKLNHVELDAITSSRYGSIAQIAYTSRTLEDSSIDRTRNIAGKVGRTNSYIQMPRSIAYASATFRYRIRRYEQGLSDMVGYEFTPNNIPAEILSRENQIFEFGDDMDLWHRSDYRISEQNGRSLIKSLSMRIRKKSENDNIYV